MKYRKLRITWSVTWGLLAVLLCMLWVRSYFASDSLSAKFRQHRWDGCCSRGTIGTTVWTDDDPEGNAFLKTHVTAPDQPPLSLWSDMLDQANCWVDYVVLSDGVEEVKYLVIRCWIPPL